MSDDTPDMRDCTVQHYAMHYTYGQVQAMKEVHAAEVEALRRERDEARDTADVYARQLSGLDVKLAELDAALAAAQERERRLQGALDIISNLDLDLSWGAGTDEEVRSAITKAIEIARAALQGETKGD